jgi:glyoxylase-like metal-dependent hydrolase (beta-lactamase superfamily II)
MLSIYNLSPSEAYGSNCYLISSRGEFAVIDPSADYYKTLASHPEIEGKVKYVLLTHTHFDHILAIKSWADRSGGVYVGREEADFLSDSSKNCYLGFLGVDDGYYGSYDTLGDGDVLTLGDEKITVIACPGHTPGGISYQIGNDIFCGDTVFAEGGYGRCDLPGGDIDVLEKSLIRLITGLPSESVFYPGHGRSTTLEELIYYFM